MTCIDLKSKSRILTHRAGTSIYGRRQVHIFATHGSRSLETLTNLRQSLQWRLQNPNLQMRGTIPRYGICSINVSPQLTRDRDVVIRKNIAQFGIQVNPFFKLQSSPVDIHDAAHQEQTWQSLSDHSEEHVSKLRLPAKRRQHRESPVPGSNEVCPGCNGLSTP